MKKSLPSLFFGIFSAPLFAHAIISNCQLQYGGQRNAHSTTVFDGPTLCNKGKSPGIRVRGPLNTTGTHFTSEVSVDGPVSANLANFTVLSVRGPAYLQQVNASVLNIKGPLFSQHSQLGTIETTSHSTKLISTYVKTLFIATSLHTKQPPVLVLKDHSHISGDVIFKGHAGIVVIDNQSSVKGKIRNGKLLTAANRNLR